MHVKRGCRLIIVFTLMIALAACSPSSEATPTDEPIFTELGLEATLGVSTTPEIIVSNIPALPTEASTLPDTEIYALLEANQCLVCHVAGDRGSALSGPSLNGLAARIESYGLSQSAESYVYESLLNPAAYLAANCPSGQCLNLMPSYAERLSNDELNTLVIFLLSLPSESP